MGVNKLRERVNIYEVTGVPDGVGGLTPTKTLVTTCWARIEQKQGARVDGDRNVHNTRPTQITMRSGSYAITNDNIIEHNGQEYTISSILIDEVKRFTIVQCSH